MKVLVAHNFYRSNQPSGENAVVLDEVRLLTAAGVTVRTLFRHSDDIDTSSVRSMSRTAFGPVRNADAVRETDRVLTDFAPDVLHVHNTNPLLSPAIVRVARRRGIPVVHTVHNYRHGCLNGMFRRDGRICEDCTGHTLPLPAVLHGCYRGSRTQSVPAAIGQVLHRRTWHGTERILVLTDFMRRHLLSLGFSPEQIVLRPTSASDPGDPRPLGRDVLFVGRLESAKGIELLLEAWRRVDRPGGESLRIVGSGPLEPEVRRAAGTSGVRFVGTLGPDGVADHMRACGLVIVPSLWYEGYPRVIAEAFAHGRAVLASDLGSLREIVDPAVGWPVAPRVEALASTLSHVLADRAGLQARGAAARRRYLEKLTPRRSMDILLSTYRSAAAATPVAGIR
jgi:glycosyltransferase involved in cell wall biosynthesis